LKSAQRIVLVTGFTPFGGEAINPSWQIAASLPSQIGDAVIERLEVPTEFGKAIKITTRAIDRLKPNVVLCLGQAGGRSALTLERIAINIDDAAICDNAGKQPIDKPIMPRGNAAYFATLPIKAMVAAMARKNLPATVSNSAGTFVCNHLLYGVLHHIDKKKYATRAGFMHVPYLPAQVVGKVGLASMSLADMCLGVEAAIAAALIHKADVKLAGGTLD
jgi:pyroglutamyl-peptidase